MYNALLFWKSTLYCSRHRAITLSRALLSLSQLNPRATTPAATRRMSSSSASGSAQRIFQLKLNPLTGDSEWVVIEEEENESAKFGKQQPLLATTSYLDMLNDTPRNKAFRQAIEKAITKPCHVLDIGYLKI